VRYAVEHPQAVKAVVGVAGKGPQRDRVWSEVYEAGQGREPAVDVDCTTVPGVPHDFWFTHPETWTAVVTDACVRRGLRP
jgi:proline iminopeptidase